MFYFLLTETEKKRIGKCRCCEEKIETKSQTDGNRKEDRGHIKEGKHDYENTN